MARAKHYVNLKRIEKKIPAFLVYLDDYSLQLAAAMAGFNWQNWRRAALTVPEVKAKYEEYIVKNKHSIDALKGWTW